MIRFLKISIVLVILLAGLTQPSYGETLRTYTWTPPTTGTPVHHYLVYLSVDGAEYVVLTVEPTINSVQLLFEDNKVYTVKVSGVDADGNEGVLSVASDPFVRGAPGCCGQPQGEG